MAVDIRFCVPRSMSDLDGPKLTRSVYNALLKNETLDLDDIAFALDGAVGELRDAQVSARRWSPFVHMGG
jgi:hypothetical protein